MNKFKEFTIEVGMKIKRKSWNREQAIEVTSPPQFCQITNSPREGGEMVFGAINLRDKRTDEKPKEIYFYLRPFAKDRWIRL